MAGIVIGVLGGIAVVLVGAWLLWRRKRQVAAPAEEVSEMPVGANAQQSFSPAKSGEFGGYYGRSELEPSTRPAELDEQHGAGELEPANMHGYYHYSTPAQEIDGTELPKRM